MLTAKASRLYRLLAVVALRESETGKVLSYRQDVVNLFVN